MASDQDQRETTAAAVPLTFADGTTYTMSPLTDRDIVELDEWVKHEYIRIVRSTLPQDVPQAERDRQMSLAYRQAMALTWLNGDGARLIATVSGMSRLVWQAIKKRHPDVTEDDLRRHMFDPRNIDAARERFEYQNLSPSEEKKGP